MKELVERIAKALVEHPEQVHLTAVNGAEVNILELRTHPDDLGRVIGRDGRTANAIRTLLGVGGVKLHKRFRLEIIDQESSSKAAGAGLAECQRTSVRGKSTDRTAEKTQKRRTPH